MTLDEQIEILQAAKRGEKIERKLHFAEANPWTPVPASIPHAFDFSNYVYRIADPYAELKAAAQDPTKQIRCKGNVTWYDAPSKWDWCLHVTDYEIRDKPKAKKVVKYLCYETCYNELMWLSESFPITPKLKRRPAFDKECEVEDE